MVCVDLSMYYSSENTCQNQVKLCTLKVKDDVQLANFCWHNCNIAPIGAIF